MRRGYDIATVVVVAAGAFASVVLAVDGSLLMASIVAAAIATALALLLANRKQTDQTEVHSGAAARAGDEDGVVAALIAALPDPAILLERDGRVLALNAGALGLAPTARSGDHVSLALRIPEVLEAILRAGTGNAAQRAEFVQRVPSERWFDVVVTPLSGASGQMAGRLLLSFHDLTAIRRVEEMRVDFVANASHELRTPLAALSGFIETLKGPARHDAVSGDHGGAGQAHGAADR
jgi:two-component system, OmpR family, phosphate regulon sensor histidine kinase PhoR